MPGPPFPAEQNCQWRSKAGLLSRRAGPGIWRLSVVPPTGPAAPEGRAPAASTMDRGPIPWGPRAQRIMSVTRKLGLFGLFFTFHTHKTQVCTRSCRGAGGVVLAAHDGSRQRGTAFPLPYRYQPSHTHILLARSPAPYSPFRRRAHSPTAFSGR